MRLRSDAVCRLAAMMRDRPRLASLFTHDDDVSRTHGISAEFHRYQRTGEGRELTELVDEVWYLDTGPLADPAPCPAGTPVGSPPGNNAAVGGPR